MYFSHSAIVSFSGQQCLEKEENSRKKELFRWLLRLACPLKHNGEWAGRRSFAAKEGLPAVALRSFSEVAVKEGISPSFKIFVFCIGAVSHS